MYEIRKYYRKIRIHSFAFIHRLRMDEGKKTHTDGPKKLLDVETLETGFVGNEKLSSKIGTLKEWLDS